MDRFTLDAMNALPGADAIDVMRRCCGSTAWCEAMVAARPFADVAAMHAAADRCFDGLSRDDWHQAFAAHPQIGDLQSLRMKYAGNREWSGGEQAGVCAADDATLTRLAAANAAYLARFGYIFIVCATGKTAADMLANLESRLPHSPDAELPVAAAEQRKITHLRIDKLLP